MRAPHDPATQTCNRRPESAPAGIPAADIISTSAAAASAALTPLPMPTSAGPLEPSGSVAQPLAELAAAAGVEDDGKDRKPPSRSRLQTATAASSAAEEVHG